MIAPRKIGTPKPLSTPDGQVVAERSSTVLKIKDNTPEKKEGGEEEVRRAVAASNATDWTKKHGPVLLDALAQC